MVTGNSGQTEKVRMTSNLNFFKNNITLLIVALKIICLVSSSGICDAEVSVKLQQFLDRTGLRVRINSKK